MLTATTTTQIKRATDMETIFFRTPPRISAKAKPGVIAAESPGVAGEETLRFRKYVFQMLIAHLALGFIVKQFPIAATVHALLAFYVALLWIKKKPVI